MYLLIASYFYNFFLQEFCFSFLVPARFEEKFKVETVRQGDSAVLRCDVTGDQPISIVWYKDKRELEITELSRYS